MCIICCKDPNAHSFYKLATQQEIQIYYSCPAQATHYNDVKGITHHIREILVEKGDAKWIYVFDGKDFGWKHMIELNVAKGVLDILIEQYDTLQEIQIINASSYVEVLMNMLKPILPTTIIEKIVWKKI